MKVIVSVADVAKTEPVGINQYYPFSFALSGHRGLRNVHPRIIFTL
jgi:hypothetical protein